MELAVYNISGAKTEKKVTLDSSIYGIDPNEHVMYLDVKQYLANLRQGTSSSKERSMITGSSRKIKKQKGSGTARAGDIKNPLFRGGGRVFGPHPRDYYFKLNKKVKRLARKSAFSSRAKDEIITVIEDFSFDAPKTKSFVELINNFKLDGKKVLLLVPETNANIYLSARNIPKVKVLKATNVNTYEILNASQILVTENSLTEIENLFK